MPVVHAVRMAHMECGEVVYTRHALMRMFERAVTTADVREILLTGELVEDYPGDGPLPSLLLLGGCGKNRFMSWLRSTPLPVDAISLPFTGRTLSSGSTTGNGGDRCSAHYAEGDKHAPVSRPSSSFAVKRP